MRRSVRPGVLAAADGRPASAAVGSRAGRRLIAPLLIAAAVLDLTRCSLVLMTFRHPAAATGVVVAGIGAAGLSLATARGCRAGQRWAVWTALLIGAASAPQASESGFRTPFTLPDMATAVLGVLLAVAILATVKSAAPGAGQPLRRAPLRARFYRDSNQLLSACHRPPAQSSCGRDRGVCLVGVEELAAEPAALVEVTAGHLDPS